MVPSLHFSPFELLRLIIDRKRAINCGSKQQPAARKEVSELKGERKSPERGEGGE